MIVFCKSVCLLLFVVATTQSEKSELRAEKEIETNQTNVLRDSKGNHFLSLWSMFMNDKLVKFKHFWLNINGLSNTIYIWKYDFLIKKYIFQFSLSSPLSLSRILDVEAKVLYQVDKRNFSYIFNLFFFRKKKFSFEFWIKNAKAEFRQSISK